MYEESGSAVLSPGSMPIQKESQEKFYGIQPQESGMMQYLTDDEMKMSREAVNLQITLGLQTCKSKGDVCQLLDEVRRHERKMVVKDAQNR